MPSTKPHLKPTMIFLVGILAVAAIKTWLPRGNGLIGNIAKGITLTGVFSRCFDESGTLKEKLRRF